MGRMIRRGAARKLDEFAYELNDALNALAPSTTEE